MNSSFLGEVLILVLLVINSCRIFFLKYGKIDALTVLAPVCVVLSVLQIIAWNADFFSILIFAVSAAAFFINFRALLRFASGLYVDHYSIAFKTGAALILFVSAVSLGILLYFRPVIVQPSDYKAVQSKVRLVGSFAGGFHTASAFESADGIVTVCAPVPEQPSAGSGAELPCVLIIPDKRADTNFYLPYMYMLSKCGFTVYSGDFSARDVKWFHSAADVCFFRRFFSVCAYLKNSHQYEAEKEFYTFNISKEIDAMVNFIRRNASENQKISIVCDWMADTAVSDYVKLHPDVADGFLNLCDFEEYVTPGFGFVRQLEPFTAFRLGFGKSNDLKEIQFVADRTLSLLPQEKNSQAEEQSNDAE